MATFRVLVATVLTGSLVRALPNPNPQQGGCPVGLASCGVACFNPAEYHCVNGELRQGPARSTSASASKTTTVPTSAVSSATSTVPTTTSAPLSTTIPGTTSLGPDPTAVPAGCPTKNTNNFCLKFQDDFTTLSQETWKHDVTMSGGGNWEFEWYTNNRTNSYTRDGVLYLHPTLTSENIGEANVVNGYTMDLNGNEAGYHCTDPGFYGCSRTSTGGNIINPVQSARITMSESVSVRFGRVEVRAKLPKGDWIWPAIWLLPKHATYGNWPASGEIDIMESRGNKPGNAQSPGHDTIGSTLHWGPSYAFNKFPLTHKEFKLPSGASFGDDFHTFGMEWTPEYLRTYVDDPKNVVLDVPLGRESFWEKGGFPSSLSNPWRYECPTAPFDHPFYLIMNVAVGGTASYFPDGAGDGKPWSNTSPSAARDFWNARDRWLPSWKGDDVAMKVDWVKIWEMC